MTNLPADPKQSMTTAERTRYLDELHAAGVTRDSICGYCNEPSIGAGRVLGELLDVHMPDVPTVLALCDSHYGTLGMPFTYFIHWDLSPS